jgi:hypothetical protein
MTELDIRGFVACILEAAAGGGDIDGGIFEEAALTHGLWVERPATAEDCESDWDFDVGDLIVAQTPALKEYLG